MTGDSVIHFTLQIEGGADSDQNEIDRLTRNLLGEISETEVEEVEIPTSTDGSPGGTKSGEAITWGQIAIVTLPTVLPAVIMLVQSWLLRQQSHAIKVKIGEIEVEIPRDLPEEKLERIVDQVKRISGKPKD